jgi:hypothetical protein
VIIRKSKNDRVTLHKNTKPGMSKRYPLVSGDITILTYPSDKKDYFVVLDGAIVKRSDSFATAEKEFTELTGEERMDLFKHRLRDNKLENR